MPEDAQDGTIENLKRRAAEQQSICNTAEKSSDSKSKKKYCRTVRERETGNVEGGRHEAILGPWSIGE